MPETTVEQPAPGQSVNVAEIMIEESEIAGPVQLGVIGILTENKATGEKIVAKAPCDAMLEAGPYVLTTWNYKKITCPKCSKKRDKECRLCDGTGSLVSFSYVLEKKNEATALKEKVWEQSIQDSEEIREAHKIARKRFDKKIQQGMKKKRT
jgi:hypothetical protein